MAGPDPLSGLTQLDRYSSGYPDEVSRDKQDNRHRKHEGEAPKKISCKRFFQDDRAVVRRHSQYEDGE